MEDEILYSVYVKTDTEGRVTAADSSAFLSCTKGWMEIDRGSGIRYRHAQGNYFPEFLRDDRGICRYMADPLADIPEGRKRIRTFERNGVEWAIYERTAEEMDADYASLPAPPPTQQERLDALEQAGLERDAALMELAMMLTGGV
ncbi:MAG: hypothetical protein J6K32_12975 [Clostridia bacterium]|nr:hypothetical protein [Clostridia bacterium]